MKTILVPFHDDEGGAAAAETGCLLARRFGAYVEGLLVPEHLESFSRGVVTRPVGDQPEWITELTNQWRDIIERSRQRFEAILGRNQITLAAITDAADGPSGGWHEARPGVEARMIGSYSRLFDLVVFGRSDPDWQTSCEAALFESGRPVIIAGSTAPRTIGERVVIAWNQSTETARTVALGMPLLAGAHSVVVLEVQGWSFPGPSGQDLVRHLARNGLPASFRSIKPAGRSNGQAILDEAAALDADLLVKGAYTQTRLREVIFGGATRHIITEARLPVLMAH